MSLYMMLLVGSISVPFVLSFDKKLAFYKTWKFVLPVISLIAGVYIAWDVWLTNQGVWGFNPNYHGSITIGGLPLEEWLFFLVVPYASLFLHYSLLAYFPTMSVNERFFPYLVYFLLILFSIGAVFFFDRTYTLYIFLHTLAALLLGLFDKNKSLHSFFITFLLILVPFLLVNGVLTGSFIDDQVVWYNDNENMGIRLFTIPIEDISYAFSMLYFSIYLIERWKSNTFSPKN